MSAGDNHEGLVIVRSVEELKKICEDVLYAVEGAWYGHSINLTADLLAKYDEEYFQNKALVLYMFTEANKNILRTVTGMCRKGDTLTLSVQRIVPELPLPAFAYWTLCLEVSQSDMQGLSQVKVKM